MSDASDQASLRDELDRLRVKLAAADDPDIQSALRARVEALEAALPVEALTPEVPAEPTVAAAPPSRAAIERAEQLVRQAKVERMRKHSDVALRLLQEAIAAAPIWPALQEMGDIHMEQRKYAKALAAYTQALTVSPKNIELERKHAAAVFATKNSGMTPTLNDAPLLTPEDRIASVNTATVISAVFPGAGHLVLGQTRTGAGILTVWIALAIWALSGWEDLARLLSRSDGQGPANLTVLLPLFGMTVLYIGTLASLKGLSREASRRPVERPTPPVNLPYE